VSLEQVGKPNPALLAELAFLYTLPKSSGRNHDIVQFCYRLLAGVYRTIGRQWSTISYISVVLWLTIRYIRSQGGKSFRVGWFSLSDYYRADWCRGTNRGLAQMYNRHTAKYQHVTLKPRLTNPKPRMVPEEHLA